MRKIRKLGPQVRVFGGEIFTCKWFCCSHDSALNLAKEIRKTGYRARIHNHYYDHPDEQWDVYIGRYVLEEPKKLCIQG